MINAPKKLSEMLTNLRALNPPNSAPLAIPTQKPIVNPIFIRSKQLGCPDWEYVLPGTAGIFQPFSIQYKFHCFFSIALLFSYFIFLFI